MQWISRTVPRAANRARRARLSVEPLEERLVPAGKLSGSAAVLARSVLVGQHATIIPTSAVVVPGQHAPGRECEQP